MVDPSARRGVPERFTLPPAPREPVSTARWHGLGPSGRRDLARRLARPQRVADADPDHLPLLADLAATRLATAWRLHVAALVLGWLLFMTFWGFGRSSHPAAVDAWRTAGLVVGVVASAVALGLVRRHLRRVQEVHALAGRPRPTERGERPPAT